MVEGERLLGRDEVAKRLDLSPLTVGHMFADGRLPGFKFGRLWKVREADLDAYIQRVAEEGTAKRKTGKGTP